MTISYTPRVIVKFKDNLVDTRKENAADEFLAQLKTGREWRQLVGKPEFQGIRIKKLLTAVTQPRLRELIKDARTQDPKYHPPNFLAYFAVHCPRPVNPEAVADEFSSQAWHGKVQFAYVAGAPGDLPVISNPGGNPDWARRDTFFHRNAPAGIDSLYAWSINGGDGKVSSRPLQIVDIESDWDLTHPDLPDNINIIHGDPYDYVVGATRTTDHGCAVLGIVAAQNNSHLGLGITPHLSNVMVASMWRHDPVSHWLFEPENAILAASDKLHFGDVLLLELTINRNGLVNLPIEYDEVDFRLIQKATARGIIVVEAAGNYQYDLGTLGVPWLNRDSSQFEDSGAIMVSAATSWVLDTNGNPSDVHAPILDSGGQRVHNYGNRIDCYAWGENIRTTRMSGEAATDADGGGDFGGTSGASAIIAGAALAIQGIVQENTTKRKKIGTRLRPKRLRDILSNPDKGTRSANYPVDKIGVMPDLRAIIEHTLKIRLRKNPRRITVRKKKVIQPKPPWKKTNPKAKKRKRTHKTISSL